MARGSRKHRAGKFPWGTSKKARTKSHKLASSSSLQEPLPADFRKREQANSRTSMPPTLSSGHSLPSGHNALPSGHNVVDAGPLLIDLEPVKQKEVEECFHTLVDHNEVLNAPNDSTNVIVKLHIFDNLPNVEAKDAKT